EGDALVEPATCRLRTEVGLERVRADHVRRDVVAERARLQPRVHALSLHEVAEEDDAAMRDVVRARRRDAVQPRAHGYDERRSLVPEQAVPGVAGNARGF